jgi:hypothetical protein
MRARSRKTETLLHPFEPGAIKAPHKSFKNQVFLLAAGIRSL